MCRARGAPGLAWGPESPGKGAPQPRSRTPGTSGGCGRGHVASARCGTLRRRALRGPTGPAQPPPLSCLPGLTPQGRGSGPWLSALHPVAQKMGRMIPACRGERGDVRRGRGRRTGGRIHVAPAALPRSPAGPWGAALSAASRRSGRCWWVDGWSSASHLVPSGPCFCLLGSRGARRPEGPSPSCQKSQGFAGPGSRGTDERPPEGPGP